MRIDAPGVHTSKHRYISKLITWYLFMSFVERPQDEKWHGCVLNMNFFKA